MTVEIHTEDPSRVVLVVHDFSDFLSEYAPNLSLDGAFLPTAEILQRGREVDFLARLEDGFALIEGRGLVAWSRPAVGPQGEPPGIGLHFLRLTEESKKLISRIVEAHRRDGGVPFDVDAAAPTKAALGPPSVEKIESMMGDAGGEWPSRLGLGGAAEPGKGLFEATSRREFAPGLGIAESLRGDTGPPKHSLHHLLAEEPMVGATSGAETGATSPEADPGMDLEEAGSLIDSLLAVGEDDETLAMDSALGRESEMAPSEAAAPFADGETIDVELDDGFSPPATDPGPAATRVFGPEEWQRMLDQGGADQATVRPPVTKEPLPEQPWTEEPVIEGPGPRGGPANGDGAAGNPVRPVPLLETIAVPFDPDPQVDFGWKEQATPSFADMAELPSGPSLGSIVDLPFPPPSESSAVPASSPLSGESAGVSEGSDLEQPASNLRRGETGDRTRLRPKVWPADMPTVRMPSQGLSADPGAPAPLPVPSPDWLPGGGVERAGTSSAPNFGAAALPSREQGVGGPREPSRLPGEMPLDVLNMADEGARETGISGAASSKAARRVSVPILLVLLILIAAIAVWVKFGNGWPGWLGFAGPDTKATAPVSSEPTVSEPATKKPASGGIDAVIEGQPAGSVEPGQLQQGSKAGVENAGQKAAAASSSPPTAVKEGSAAAGTPGARQASPAAASLPAAGPVETPVTGAPSAGFGGSSIQFVEWRTEGQSTVVVLNGDGRFRVGDLQRERLGGDRPREVLKIVGAARAFSRTTLEVGSNEVARLRFGFHASDGRGEQHVVADLTAPNVRLASVETEGNRLVLRFDRSR